jgi:LPS export ABC transporter protein LptC
MKLMIYLALMVFLSTALYYLWQADTPSMPENTNTQSYQKPMVMHQAELFDYRDNRLRWQVRTDTARIYEKQYLTLLDAVEGAFFDRQPKPKQTRVRADYGKIQGSTRVLSLWGEVQIDFSNGQRLLTEQLFIDQDREIIYNDTEVHLISDNDRIIGTSLHYDIKTTILVLTKPQASLGLIGL